MTYYGTYTQRNTATGEQIDQQNWSAESLDELVETCPAPLYYYEKNILADLHEVQFGSSSHSHTPSASIFIRHTISFIVR